MNIIAHGPDGKVKFTCLFVAQSQGILAIRSRCCGLRLLIPTVTATKRGSNSSSCSIRGGSSTLSVFLNQQPAIVSNLYVSLLDGVLALFHNVVVGVGVASPLRLEAPQRGRRRWTATRNVGGKPSLGNSGLPAANLPSTEASSQARLFRLFPVVPRPGVGDERARRGVEKVGGGAEVRKGRE